MSQSSTATNFDSQYFARGDECRPMSRQEERDSFARLQAGDEEAKEAIIRANLRFVRRVAYEYATRRRPGGMTLEEIESEGIIGLFEALDRFDPSLELKFISYAVWWIRQAILKALGENGSVVRAPLSRTHRSIQAAKTTDLLAQQLQRMPTLDDVFDALAIPESSEFRTIPRGDLSLDRAIFSEDQSTKQAVKAVVETLVDPDPLPDEVLECGLRRETVDLLLCQCHDNIDRKIVSLYYGLEGQPGPWKKSGKFLA